MRKKNLFLAVGFVLLWNSGFIGAEYGLPYTGPFTLIFWRYLALTFIILIYLLIKKRFKGISLTAMGYNMMVGFLAHGVWLSCVMLALEQNIPAGIIALVVALQPLVTGAFSGMAVGEPTPLRQWLGLVTGFAGVALTVLFRIDFNAPGSVFGYLIPLGSVIAITVATLIQRKMDIRNTNYHLPLDLTLFYQSLATVAALSVPAVLVEKLETRWEPEFIFTLAWLTVGVSLSAYALMWQLIERMDATRVASLFYLGPPVTMLMAWLAFGDTLKVMDIIGLTVVFAGIVLTHLQFRRYQNE
jgi:drug/metabolite transporter (DMT)-like permease